MVVTRMEAPARRLAAPAGAAALGAAATGAIWLGDPTAPGGLPLPPCPTHALFGLLCPGCGGMRMVYSLLHADVAAAVHYNALALAAMPLVALAWLAWTWGRWRGRDTLSWVRRRWITMSVLGVLAGWTVARNLPFAPFTALQI